MVERDKRINVTASEEERQMLFALAERDGVSASDWIRQAIRKAHAKAFPSPKPPESTT